MRFDGSRRELVLAGRVRVTLAFTGREAGEIGTGSRGRALPRRRRSSAGVLAQLHTSRRGLHAVSFEALFPARPRGFSTSSPAAAAAGRGGGVPRRARGSGVRPGERPLLLRGPDGGVDGLLGARWRTSWCARRRGDGGGLGASGGGSRGLVLDRVCLVRDEPDLPAGASGGAGHLAVGRDGRRGRRADEGLRALGGGRGSAEAARLVVHLQGGSESGATADHHVRVSVNGVDAGGGDVCREAAVSAGRARSRRGCCGRGRTSSRSRTWGTRGCTRSCSWTGSRSSYPQASAARRRGVRGGVERGRDGGGRSGLVRASADRWLGAGRRTGGRDVG